MRLKYVDIILTGKLSLIDIFTDKWLNEIGVDTSNKIFSTTSPGMTVYSSKRFDVVATLNNLKIIVKNSSSVDDCISILQEYIKISFGISKFKAMGFNFIWETKKIKTITINVEEVNNLQNVFGKNSPLSYGAVFYSDRKDHKLRLLIEIMQNPAFEKNIYALNFNFNHLIENKNSGEINHILQTFGEKMEESKRIAKVFSLEKEVAAHG